MNKFPTYNFLPDLFLRTPYYSFEGYDPERIDQILADPGFRNGLFLASPTFYKTLSEKDFDYAKLTDKGKHSVHKYYNRMCFRPTPFGSFASFTPLTWGHGETVKLAGDIGTVLHLLPDAKMVAMRDARTCAEMDDYLLIKNPTLYLLGNEYRFVKSVIDASGHYRFSLDAVVNEGFYPSLFHLLRQPVQKTELIAWIIQETGCNETEAKEFFEFLLTEQILYNPAVGHIIDNVNTGHEFDPRKKVWSKFQVLTVKMSTSLISIAKDAALILGEPDAAGSQNYFYAGLERNLQCGGPGEDDQAEISQAIELMRRLATPYSSIQLCKFIDDFQDRFDREKVPLLLALDPDSGVSYGNFGISALVSGFEDIQILESQEIKESIQWTKLHGWLFRHLAAARESGRFAPLDLTEVNFSELEAIIDPGIAPSTVAVMFRKTPDHVLIEYAGGATATALIGRFSVFSEVAAALCHKLANIETLSHSDIVFADIGQLSDEHSDNINRRLQIYPYELPLNVYSVLTDIKQLKPEDLTLCVRDGQLILESTKLQKRVIPRLASAYNYHHNELAIFRLLGDLQYQDLHGNLNFNLENFFPGLNFYPRVVIGRAIISPARWYFDRNEIANLHSESDAETLTKLSDFRQRFGLPPKVSIGKFDQQLVFDLTCRQEVSFFLNYIKGLDNVIVTEYLNPDHSIKIGSEPFAGQYISFLHHGERIYEGTMTDETPSIDDLERNFSPGSNWLYIKIYCTPAVADRIIAGVVAPVIENNRGLIRKWFFIRYVDNGYHLRVRFLTDETHIGRLMLEMKSQLTASGYDVLVRNYQVATYKREMERYAGLIEPVEDFFYAGSQLTANYLQLVETQEEVRNEFFIGLYTSFHLISCFTDEMSAIKEFTGWMAEGFIKKFVSNKDIKKDMDLKYRSMRTDIEALLKGPLPFPSLGSQFTMLINNITVIANRMAEEPSKQWHSMLADLVHMQMNRTFSVKQRTHEFMVYYFLNKYALSQEARVLKNSLVF